MFSYVMQASERSQVLAEWQLKLETAAREVQLFQPTFLWSICLSSVYDIAYALSRQSQSRISSLEQQLAASQAQFADTQKASVVK